MKKWLFIILGSITFGIGTLGIFLPLLPTTVFYLMTGFFWVRSSEKLHQRFVQSSYYERYIRPFVQKEMSTKSIVRMFLGMLLVFGISFWLIEHALVRLLLVLIYLALVIGLTWYLKGSKKVVRVRKRE